MASKPQVSFFIAGLLVRPHEHIRPSFSLQTLITGQNEDMTMVVKAAPPKRSPSVLRHDRRDKLLISQKHLAAAHSALFGTYHHKTRKTGEYRVER